MDPGVGGVRLSEIWPAGFCSCAATPAGQTSAPRSPRSKPATPMEGEDVIGRRRRSCSWTGRRWCGARLLGCRCTTSTRWNDRRGHRWTAGAADFLPPGPERAPVGLDVLREGAGRDPGRPRGRPPGPVRGRGRAPVPRRRTDWPRRSRTVPGPRCRWPGTPTAPSSSSRLRRRPSRGDRGRAGETGEEPTHAPAEFLESLASRSLSGPSSARPRRAPSPPRAGPGVGRAPTLPVCGGPLDLTGHVCPRSNGYKR